MKYGRLRRTLEASSVLGSIHFRMASIRRPPGGSKAMYLFTSFCAFHLVAFLAFGTCGANEAEGEALLRFMTAADPNKILAATWTGSDPCTQRVWAGITCSGGQVNGIVLNNMNLKGTIGVSTLSQLGQLRILSLDGNGLTGTIPADLTNCTQLKQLYLSNNNLSGPIPSPLSGRLRRLYLSNNKLSGNIPSSLATDLPDLLTLSLENNMLTGTIPSFNQLGLTTFNVSNNLLSGPIPSTPVMAQLDVESFSGNSLLCGNPLPACPSTDAETSNATVQPGKSSPIVNPGTRRKSGAGEVVGILVGIAVFVFLITVCLLYFCQKPYAEVPMKEDRMSTKINPLETREFQSSMYQSSMQELVEDKPRLVFFKDQHTFKLEDLLRASAEYVGKGSLGTVYKALMGDGTVVAVKRLKDMDGSGEKEFVRDMELVGRIHHANLVPFWAYYYSHKERLLVSEYQTNGNVSTLLHGDSSSQEFQATKPVPWTVRLKIARGVARGLAHLHHESDLPHGNIKDTNILVDSNFQARIADFGMAGMLLASRSAVSKMIGYIAPEFQTTQKVSQKSDVYSFGVLLLQLLTGRKATELHSVAGHRLGPARSVSLPQWVNSVVRQEWTAEVFDRTLVATHATEESLVSLLQIAMSCVSTSPDQRPTMKSVLPMIEEIKEDEQNWDEQLSPMVGGSPMVSGSPIGRSPTPDYFLFSL